MNGLVKSLFRPIALIAAAATIALTGCKAAPPPVSVKPEETKPHVVKTAQLPPTFTPTPTATYMPAPTPIPTITPTPFVDILPPRIKNLKWQPGREINGKVYSGRVSFEAVDDDSPIAYAKLKFIPVKYKHLPPEAFPEEPPRKFDLKPLDGAFDELEEEFAVDITDIIGGREYKAVVIVKDKAGNTITGTLETPWIREFENIAALDDILIGAFYYPWYSSKPIRHWPEGYKGIPILGEYNSRDPAVISKHIDWATGHGIDFLCVSWWGPRSWEDITLRDFILKNPLIDDIQICILYESKGRFFGKGKMNFDSYNRIILLDDLRYLSDTYFSNPRYLKIDGRPVVFIYAAKDFEGDVNSAINEIREQLESEKGYNPFLIGDQVYWQSPDAEREKNLAKAFDAISAYTMHASVPDINTNFVQKVLAQYKLWSSMSNKVGVYFIPEVMPGFDDTRVRPEARHPVIDRNPERFKRFCEGALRYLDPRIRMVLITSWNEWHEYTQIEPAVDYGFDYLRVIKEVLAGLSLADFKDDALLAIHQAEEHIDRYCYSTPLCERAKSILLQSENAFKEGDYLLAKYLANEARATLNPAGICIDGSDEDWTARYEPIARDALGDLPSREKDLDSVWITNDENNLYFMVKFAGECRSDVCLFFDINSDGVWDYHIKAGPTPTFIAKTIRPDYHEFIANLERVCDKVLEFKVPLKLLNYPTTFRFQMFSWDEEKQGDADKMKDFDWIGYSIH